MADLFPLWWASAATVVIFLLLGLGCWLVKKEAFMSDAPDQASWRDLRWWASGLIVLQLFIYYLFS
ncbi:MAG: hypothetical protein QGG67_10300 [Gammaproteobacteria bacterium]|jgi:hypothetical protein|nr:hypothetical protein [Gammaproteobacteria bacterium]|tara:strand:- start:202 stop:399 length:198 start_codon:yes stop_codon:yes gene_type:complete